jgi:hypothetical protein
MNHTLNWWGKMLTQFIGGLTISKSMNYSDQLGKRRLQVFVCSCQKFAIQIYQNIKIEFKDGMIFRWYHKLNRLFKIPFLGKQSSIMHRF